MGQLDNLTGPEALKNLDHGELLDLAREIREFLIDKVSRTGGHLGPNLGVVELTIALHRVFDSPHDSILWDTGHQSYVHKMLTGRTEGFDRLRKRGGLSGYPSRAESAHDLIENSHASTALSYADGLAKAYALRGATDRAVVPVIGDGALTGGMTWEALNNIAAGPGRPMVVVVNDNGRSYAPTVGGFAAHLAALRTSHRYESLLEWGKKVLAPAPLVYDALHGLKKGMKDVFTPQGMYEGLGLKYVGPVDGHDIAAVEFALRRAHQFRAPVIVHCVTRKGEGYPPAENDEADRFHAVRVMDPRTGRSAPPTGTSWTSVFADELVAVGEERDDVVAITAAMPGPTGLSSFAERFPERAFDVGIAEQHAVTSAAGLATAGLRPVVAVYSTFLNRAFDQVVMDVALHRCPVVFVLDRAGVTGDDGASHNGMWDVSLLNLVPGLRMAAPRDAATLRAALREAVEESEGPTVVRFPKGQVGPDIHALAQSGGLDILRQGTPGGPLLIATGPMVGLGLAVAGRLSELGTETTVVDPRWIAPLSPALTALAARHTLVATVEDNLRTGGLGAVLTQALQDAGAATAVCSFGIPRRFLDHGSRGEVLADCGLTEEDIVRALVERLPDRTAGGPAIPGQDPAHDPVHTAAPDKKQP